jgi:hypothetical protein
MQPTSKSDIPIRRKEIRSRTEVTFTIHRDSGGAEMVASR